MDFFLFSSTFSPIGTEIENIKDEKFRVPSVIRWRTDSGFGTQFKEISPKLINAINNISD